MWFNGSFFINQIEKYKKALTNLSLIMPDQSNQPQAQNAGESKLVLLSKLFKYENFSVDYQLTPLS